MITVRRAGERGHADHGWLDTHHTFSFADYHDPAHMGFGPLRVLNEDRVAPGEGFPTHGHRDMEILTWVLSGALAHKDSLGSGAVLKPGELQRMTAGTGIRHSEFNASPSDPVHFLQIWAFPARTGLAPDYEQKAFPPGALENKLGLVAAPDGREGALRVNQDLTLAIARLAPGKSVVHLPQPGRLQWVQVARGAVDLNGTSLAAGDGAGLDAVPELKISATVPSEILVFDMTARAP